MRIGKDLSSWKSKGATLFLCLVTVASLSACDLAANYQKIDRASDMEVQDFRDGMAERLPEVEKKDAKFSQASSIPSLQPYVSSKTVQEEPMPLVSVSVNQSVPVRDVLYELAEQADYDLELDPAIRGSIIFTARNKPFDQVIDRISDIAGLRYKFKDDYLRVELDTPYNKVYKIDYLSYLRQNSSTVSTNVSVVSGEGADTGSAFTASSESLSDFWGELESNLAQIIGGGTAKTLSTKRDPRVTAVEQNPDVQAVAPEQGEDGEVNVQPPEAVLRVESVPVEDEDEDDENGPRTGFAINKQAGLINVLATEKQHKEIQEYMKLLKTAVTSQVLIEAKIFEVNLFDEYVTGIDWTVVGLSGGEGFTGFLDEGGNTLLGLLEANNGSGVFTAPATEVGTLSNFIMGYSGNDFAGLLQAISGFGTVRALASPRLTVLNNQAAVLNVATNVVFFEVDIDSTTDEGVTEVDIESEIKTVPEGVLVSVQPSINLEERTISMAVRPTITRVVDVVNDPAVTFAASRISGAENVVSQVPQLNVQEIDTLVKVNSGQPIVMGGLLQDRAESSQEAVPILGETPIVGGLFRKQADLIRKTELVIFLKATILEQPNETIHPTDRDLYKAFSGDRRPFKL